MKNNMIISRKAVLKCKFEVDRGKFNYKKVMNIVMLKTFCHVFFSFLKSSGVRYNIIYLDITLLLLGKTT